MENPIDKREKVIRRGKKQTMTIKRKTTRGGKMARWLGIEGGQEWGGRKTLVNEQGGRTKTGGHEEGPKPIKNNKGRGKTWVS